MQQWHKYFKHFIIMNLNLKLHNFIILLSLLVVYSCFDNDTSHLSNNKLYFNGQINSSKLLTKQLNSSWEENDAIGVFMIQNETLINEETNKKFITSGDGNFFNDGEDNEMHYPNNSTVDFIAYYPYSDQLLTDYIYPINVTDQSNPSNIDFLYSDNAKQHSVGNIPYLNFHHILSKLKVIVKAGKEVESLSNLKLSISNVNTLATYNLLSKDFTINTNNAEQITFNNISHTEKQIIAEAILLPSDKRDRELIFKLNVNNEVKMFRWNMSHMEFKSGYQNTISFILDNEEDNNLQFEGNTINPWEDGEGEENTIDLNAKGTNSNPYTTTQASNKIGEKNKWVKGYLILFNEDNNNNILVLSNQKKISSSSTEIILDLTHSPIAEYLNTDILPELIEQEISLEGDIIKNTNNNLTLNNIKDIKGGQKLLFSESFGEEKVETSNMLLVDYQNFDMKDVQYWATPKNSIYIRSTTGFDNHAWLRSGTSKMTINNLNISETDSLILKYKITSFFKDETGKSNINILKVEVDNTKLEIPDMELNKSNANQNYHLVKLILPNKKINRIAFSTDQETNLNGFRIDDIQIIATK